MCMPLFILFNKPNWHKNDCGFGGDAGCCSPEIYLKNPHPNKKPQQQKKQSKTNPTYSEQTPFFCLSLHLLLDKQKNKGVYILQKAFLHPLCFLPGSSEQGNSELPWSQPLLWRASKKSRTVLMLIWWDLLTGVKEVTLLTALGNRHGIGLYW